MKNRSKRLLYLIIILIGVTGILGLAGWDFYQVRSAALAKNQRWVDGMSALLSAERQSLTRWIERFPVQSSTFRDIANSRSDVAGLYMSDRKRIQSLQWLRPGLQSMAEPLDPRLPVLLLQAMDKQKTLPGPVVFARGK